MDSEGLDDGAAGLEPERAATWGLWRSFTIQMDETEARQVLARHAGLIGLFLRRSPLPKQCKAFDTKDLEAVAKIMVLQAHLSYDSTRGSFSNWAMRLLQQSFIDIARRARSIDRGEQRLYKKQRALERYEAGRHAGRVVGSEPEALTDKQQRLLRGSLSRQVISTDQPFVNRGADGGDLGPTLTFDGPSPEDLVDRRIESEWLKKKLSNGLLTDKEKEVVFRVLSGRYDSWDAIAGPDRSRQAAEALYGKAVNKLRSEWQIECRRQAAVCRRAFPDR